MERHSARCAEVLCASPQVSERKAKAQLCLRMRELPRLYVVERELERNAYLWLYRLTMNMMTAATASMRIKEV